MDRRLKDSNKTLIDIQGALLKLLKDKDISKIRITDIAKECKINRTTFYLFYENKYDVLLDICISFSNRYIEHMMDGLMSNSKEKAILFYEKEFREIKSFSKTFRIIYNIPIEGKSLSAWLRLQAEDVILQYLKDKKYEMKYGGDLKLFSKLYAAISISTLEIWLTSDNLYIENLISNVVEDIQYRGFFNMLKK